MNILNNKKGYTSETTLFIETYAVGETILLGSLIGSLLKAGDVVALIGHLGAGKTHLVKGIAEGLGIEDKKGVTSPSYVLINQYMGRLPVYHFDAYRLESAAEMYDIDCVEFFWGNGVSLVEWADKIMECLPDEFITVTMNTIGQTTREILISYHGERYKGFLKGLRSGVQCLK
ncbi:MAG: tRNA (adenosine(37)-N6)-threonylcarbamoyltransferase complex ATPase subunit type 1 TsaE [Candidatus Scalindua sp.]|nr:tRNA (adenosine(37)-N6)-threonylcarbamoyltransferase complex ATPase subunit type 1 TsaE [Candidatus Scalindua sp.]